MSGAQTEQVWLDLFCPKKTTVLALLTCQGVAYAARAEREACMPVG